MSDIDIGQISEILNDKVDLPRVNNNKVPQDMVDFVIARQEPTAENNYTWYELHKSGWLSQGGFISADATNKPTLLVNLIIPMKDTNYSVFKQIYKGNDSINFGSVTWVADSASGVENTTTSIYLSIANNTYQKGMYWKVEGYADLTGTVIEYSPSSNEYEIKYEKTNCVIEVPQYINIKLVDNGLILKANSKIYYPDGTTYTIPTDKTRNDFSLFVTGEYLVYYSQSYGNIIANGTTSSYSGTNDTVSTTTKHVYWNTADNKIRLYNTSGLEIEDLSIPICQVSITNGTGITSINQIFNGIGYCGSTIFALPGLKGVSPNGRNYNGTLKNKLITNNKILLTSISEDGSSEQLLHLFFNSSKLYRYFDRSYFEQDTVPNYSSYGGNLWYNNAENLYYTYSTTSKKWVDDISNKVHLTLYIYKDKNIIKFNNLLSYESLNKNRTDYICSQSFPSKQYIDLTLGSSGSTYIAPADGYISFIKVANNSGQFVSIYTTDKGRRINDYPNVNTNWGSIIFPVNKGENFIVEYSVGGESLRFRFYYANGGI